MFDKYCWINCSIFAVSLIKWGGFRVYKLPFEKNFLAKVLACIWFLKLGIFGRITKILFVQLDMYNSVQGSVVIKTGLSWRSFSVLIHTRQISTPCRNLMGAYTHEVQLIRPLHETYVFIAIWAITFNIVQIYTLLWSFDYGHWGRISWRLDFIFCWFTLGCFLLSR